MVARPEVAITVDRMTVDDLPAVHVIEHESFSTPWPSHAYRQELETNRLAHYIVARVKDEIVGFAGMWLLVDEAHITTFATRTTWRRQGVGERLLLALLELSAARGATEATLEVRPTNIGARRLHTVMERLLEEISFTATDQAGTVLTIDAAYVRDKVAALAKNTDLSKFIL